MILMLPDEEGASNGPATLYMVPRDAIRAWIKMTPKLNDVLTSLQRLAYDQAMREHPVEMEEWLEKDGDDSFIDKIMMSKGYVKVFTSLSIAAVVDYRETLGKEEFEEYAVHDPEILEEFYSDTNWRGYTPEDGLTEKYQGKERFEYEDGKVTMKPID